MQCAFGTYDVRLTYSEKLGMHNKARKVSSLPQEGKMNSGYTFKLDFLIL